MKVLATLASDLTAPAVGEDGAMELREHLLGDDEASHAHLSIHSY